MYWIDGNQEKMNNALDVIIYPQYSVIIIKNIMLIHNMVLNKYVFEPLVFSLTFLNYIHYLLVTYFI